MWWFDPYPIDRAAGIDGIPDNVFHHLTFMASMLAGKEIHGANQQPIWPEPTKAWLGSCCCIFASQRLQTYRTQMLVSKDLGTASSKGIMLVPGQHGLIVSRILCADIAECSHCMESLFGGGFAMALASAFTSLSVLTLGISGGFSK